MRGALVESRVQVRWWRGHWWWALWWCPLCCHPLGGGPSFDWVVGPLAGGGPSGGYLVSGGGLSGGGASRLLVNPLLVIW